MRGKPKAIFFVLLCVLCAFVVSIYPALVRAKTLSQLEHQPSNPHRIFSFHLACRLVTAASADTTCGDPAACRARSCAAQREVASCAGSSGGRRQPLRRHRGASHALAGG